MEALNPATILVIFSLSWWLVFFLVLPFGAHAHESPEQGHAPSAPARPRILMKAGIATVVAIVLTVLLVMLLDKGVISLRPDSVE